MQRGGGGASDDLLASTPKGRVARMRTMHSLAHVVGLLALLACGGETTASNSDGGSPGASSSGGSSGGSASGSSSGGTSSGSSSSGTASSSGASSSSGSGTGSSSGGLPAPGTPACDAHADTGPTGICVLCSDDLWHCHLAVFGVCPNPIQVGAACAWKPPPIDTSGNCLMPCPTGQGLVALACSGGVWQGPQAGSDNCQ